MHSCHSGGRWANLSCCMAHLVDEHQPSTNSKYVMQSFLCQVYLVHVVAFSKPFDFTPPVTLFAEDLEIFASQIVLVRWMATAPAGISRAAVMHRQLPARIASLAATNRAT